MTTTSYAFCTVVNASRRAWYNIRTHCLCPSCCRLSAAIQRRDFIVSDVEHGNVFCMLFAKDELVELMNQQKCNSREWLLGVSYFLLIFFLCNVHTVCTDYTSNDDEFAAEYWIFWFQFAQIVEMLPLTVTTSVVLSIMSVIYSDGRGN